MSLSQHQTFFAAGDENNKGKEKETNFQSKYYIFFVTDSQRYNLIDEVINQCHREQISFRSIVSNKHAISTIFCKKDALNGFDNKRYIVNPMITYARGHKDSKTFQSNMTFLDSKGCCNHAITCRE